MLHINGNFKYRTCICALLILGLLTAAPALAACTQGQTKDMAARRALTTIESRVDRPAKAAAFASGKDRLARGVAGSATQRRLRAGAETLLLNAEYAATGFGRTESPAARKAHAGAWKDRVECLNWFGEGENVLKKDEYGMLFDIETGITLRIKRMGGHNHADVEPASAADTEKLKALNGGQFGWESHACILYAGGRYVACAINTKPHGQQTIRDNDYNGQFCLHMVGSITHGTHRVNAQHQAAITTAYNWAQ